MHRTPIVAAASAAATLALSGTALAQSPGEVIIEIDQPVLMPGQSTTVRLLAGFDSTEDFAMAGLITDLFAEAGGVSVGPWWSDVGLVFPMGGPGTTAGVPVDGGFAGVLAGQLHDPFEPYLTNPSNPIAFWEATFTAPLDAGAFAVDLSTRTARFDVYVAIDSRRSESRLDGLTEGSGRIIVVPSPASGLVMLGLLASRRRR